MRNWRSSVTAILGIHDVYFTTPPSSSVVLIQNDALYREHKEERTDTDNNSVKDEKMHMP